MDITGQTFIRGNQLDNGRFLVSTQDPGLDIETQPHQGLCYWTDDDGWVEIGLAAKITVDAALSEDGARMLTMDASGFLHETDGDDTDKEILKDADGNIPAAPFRCIRRIGSQLFVAGVERQVQRRDGGDWQIVSAENDAEKPCAFQGIDGFGPEEVYAAGWDGEIWAFDGAKWEQRDSPSRIVLNDICAGPDACVAVGLAGEIVVGRHNDWALVKHDETSEPFWSVRAFKGAFYLSALSGIYKLESGELSLFRETDEDMRTAYALSVGPSGLWSVGAHDIALFDGEGWRTIAQA